MARDDVAVWLARYVEAWRTFDPELIGSLFSTDAEYRFRPSDKPLVGREAIVADWLAEPDQAGTWEASYEAWAIVGDRAVATGATRYQGGEDGRDYRNVFLLEFDADGRCRSFTEVWVKER